jgi:hypothetical protein
LDCSVNDYQLRSKKEALSEYNASFCEIRRSQKSAFLKYSSLFIEAHKIARLFVSKAVSKLKSQNRTNLFVKINYFSAPQY